MKKNLCFNWEWKIPGLIKLFRVMKLTAFLLLVSVAGVLANKSYSQTKMLNLNMRDVTVKEILNSIEKQSEFYFLFSENLVDTERKVNIEIDNQKIEQALNLLFEGTDVSYSIRDRIIVLTTPEVLSEESELFQQKSISGTVTDEAGQSLPGVTVLIKGTTNGTVTNTDGNYSLTNIPDDATLVFSFVGMISQEILVDTQTSIDITMIVDAIGIEEVVAIGYGTQKKVNLTGSVSNVDFESIANRPASNSVNALVGTIPGMTVVQGGGQPGNDQASINIRGIGSINASSDPLVIIDGVTSSLSDFALLSPHEIKEISVLKDASSAAIYGSRAANGVILITTKSGNKEGINVSLNTYWGMQEATVLPQVLDAWDNALLENEARENAGLPKYFTDEHIALMKNNDPSDGFSNTNWAEQVIKTSPVQNYNLGINAGNKKLKVFTGLNYFKQDGIIINTSSERFNLRNKLDFVVNDNIKFGLNVSAMKQKGLQSAINERTSPNFGDGIGGNTWTMMSTVFVTPQFFPIYYNNGNYFMELEVPGYQRMNNPVMAANYGSIERNTKDFVSALTAEIKFGDFTFNSLLSYKYNDQYVKQWKPRQMIENDNGIIIWDTSFAMLSQSFLYSNMAQIENYLNYSKKFADSHFISILAGHTFLDNNSTFFRAYGENFPSNSIQVLNASSADSQRAYGYDSSYSLQSFFGRLNYSFKNKYLIESNLRYDGSSRFAKEYRYGFFPSFALGWRISEESFLKDISAIDNLKLRGSWGILGNQAIGSNYAFASVYSTSASYLVNGQLVTGAAVTEMANNSISWESTKTLNTGIDLSLFGHLNLTFDYFIKDTEDMLIKLPIPITLGALNEPYQNIGKIQNKGWEFALQYNNNINQLNYNFEFNIGKIKNSAIDLNNQEWYINDQIIREGESLYSWYGYRTNGIFQNQQEIDEAATQTPAALPGDIRYVDVNGIDGIPDGKIDSYDRTIIGKSFPEISYGFNGGLAYKNFDFNVFFQGVAGVEINNYSVINHTGAGSHPKNWTVEWMNRWTPENPSDKYPRLDANRANNGYFSDFWLEEGSYLRLKNLEFGYTFSQNIMNKVGIENLRVYFGGQNLITFTNLKHFDPERSINQVRSEFYPQLRVYQIGFNLTF